MNLRTSTLALLALTMIPSGMALTSSENASQQQELDAIYKKLNLKKAKPAPEKPLTTWEKIKQKLAWFNVNRVLGITGVVLLGWMLKRQFFSEDGKGGNLNLFSNKKKELRFKNGYRQRLGVPAQRINETEIRIQGPNGREIIIQQVNVVHQSGPTCPYHASMNADIFARAEAAADNAQRDKILAEAKDPDLVAQRIVESADHIEKVINGDQAPHHEPLKVLVEDESLKKDTASNGWAEQPIPVELLARTPGVSRVVSYNEENPDFDEAAFRNPGIHRAVVISRDARDKDGNGHYYTVVCHRTDDNHVKYIVSDSMGNRDRRADFIINKLIHRVEWNPRDDIAENVRGPINDILNGRAPAGRRPRNEGDVKNLGAANMGANNSPADPEPARGQTHAPNATATATPTAAAS